ncbi:MAG: sensor histidine kinase [Agriterribacter sp.]
MGFIIAFFLLGLFILLLSILYSNRQIKNKKEKAELQTQFSQTLLQSQLEIQEQTLRHVSRELHDNIGQVASLIKINLNTMVLEDQEKANQKIEDTKDLIRQLITDVKALSVNLGSDRVTRVGLIKSLETEVERLNKTGEFTAEFIMEGDLPRINDDSLIILYRMAQEIINNIVKHSRAKHIRVLLNANEKVLTLAMQDDGVGFDVEEKKKQGGAGLFNLQNRAKLINAQLAIISTQGNGTATSIQMPL